VANHRTATPSPNEEVGANDQLPFLRKVTAHSSKQPPASVTPRNHRTQLGHALAVFAMGNHCLAFLRRSAADQLAM